MARYWYLYNGLTPDTAVGHYIGPILPTLPDGLCTSGEVACAIFVPSGGHNPDAGVITLNIASYLAIAKLNQFSFYPFLSTPYVATRPS